MENNTRSMIEHAIENNGMGEMQKRARESRGNVPEGYTTSQEASKLFDVTRGRAQYILNEKGIDYTVIKVGRNNVHIYKEEDVWDIYVRRCEERRVKPGERRFAKQQRDSVRLH